MEVLNSSSEREEACGIRSQEKKEYNVNSALEPIQFQVSRIIAFMTLSNINNIDKLIACSFVVVIFDQ